MGGHWAASGLRKCTALLPGLIFVSCAVRQAAQQQKGKSALQKSLLNPVLPCCCAHHRLRLPQVAKRLAAESRMLPIGLISPSIFRGPLRYI
jgi:hypothetical protein